MGVEPTKRDALLTLMCAAALALLILCCFIGAGCASPHTACIMNVNWRSAQGYDVSSAVDGGGLKLPGAW